MDGHTDRRLSLVIPAFDEEAGIRQAVAEADDALARLTADYEVLVIDDGCTDRTAAIAEEMQAERPHVRLLRHPRNQGYGAALRTGFSAARFERVAFTDADCQFHLEDLGPLLQLADEHDVAVGWRIDRKDPWRRRFFSWGYNVLVRTLLGTAVRDCDCALKVFRRESLAGLLPETHGFFVNSEMLAKARQQGLSIAEVGVQHRPRLHGDSKVSLLDIPRTLRTLLPFWWSRVLFPAADVSTSTPASLLGPVLLIIAAALLCFARLGTPLQEPDEGRYAEIPRQMLAAGNWIVPVLHGETYPDKPPLLYWLVMLSYRLFGPHDWAARIVPGLAVFLTVLTTYLWGRRTLGARAGLAAAFVLLLSARYVYLGRLLTIDTVLALCITAALAAGHAALLAGTLRRGTWLLSAAACGLGVLAKGPVALALVIPPLLLAGLLDPRLARPRLRDWGGYLAVVLGLAAPWFVAMSVCEPTFPRYFFWTHNVVRYVAPFDHAQPFWYFLPAFLLGLMPGALLLPGLVQHLARRSGDAAARRPAAVGFVLIATVWVLAFYSVGGSKRPAYILPALPPFALLLGWYLETIADSAVLGSVARWAVRPGVAGSAVALVTALGLAVLGTVEGIVTPRTGLLLAAAVVAMLAGVWRIGPALRPRTAWRVCGALTFVVLFGAVQVLLPGHARRFSLRGHVRPYAPLCAAERVPVVCYPRHWDSVNFYLQSEEVRVFGKAQRASLLAMLCEQPCTVLVTQPDEARRLADELPGTMEYVPGVRRGAVTVGVVRQRLPVPDVLLALAP